MACSNLTVNISKLPGTSQISTHNFSIEGGMVTSAIHEYQITSLASVLKLTGLKLGLFFSDLMFEY